MKQLLPLTFTHFLLFARSLPFAIYMVITFGLALMVAFVDNLEGGGGFLVVRISNNVLFFQLPFLALLIAPLYAQHRGTRKDWLWASPLELPTLILSHLVAIIGAICAVFVLGGLPLLLILVLADMIPLNATSSLYGYYLLLVIPTTIMAAGIVASLSLLIRNTFVVTAVMGGISALVWLGLLMPTATLITPLNYTLLTLNINSVAGIGAERPLLVSLLLFYLAWIPPTLILATIAYAQIDQRAGWTPKRRPQLAILMVLAAAGFSAGWWVYAENVTQQVVPAPISQQTDVWEVVDAEQIAILEEQVLQAKITLLLRNKTDQPQSLVELNLNPGLHIVSADTRGKETPTRQTGETIWIEDESIQVTPGETTELTIRYEGVPVLLREDVQTARATMENDPPSFQKPHVSYVDNHTLQWMRDSDWLAWPLSVGPHVASNSHRLQISVKNTRNPVLSSGTTSKQTQDHTTFAWQNPPQFLLAQGVYEKDLSHEGEVWLGKLSTNKTKTTAAQLLRLHNALSEWLQPSVQNQPHRVIETPYVRDAVMGGTILGFANTVDKQTGWTATTILDLAIPVSNAWLLSQIRWPENKLTQNGVIKSYELVCGSAQNVGYASGCTLKNLGGPNPQAQSGRWIQEAEHQSDTIPLRQAFAVVIAQELVSTLTNDDSHTQQEQNKWIGLLPGTQVQEFAQFANFPTGAYSERENCQLAHLVLTLLDFKSHHGPNGLAKLINTLSQQHPPNGPAITEESMLQTLNNLGHRSTPSPTTC